MSGKNEKAKITNLKKNAIEFYKNLFTFTDTKFNYIILNNTPYFKAKDIAIYLEYKNTNKSIKDHVDKEDKYILEELLNLNNEKNEKNEENFMGNESLPMVKNKDNYTNSLNQYERKAIYINKAGLIDLIWNSKKEEAKKLKNFISNYLLPTVFKTGYFDMDLDLDTSYVESFYESNDPKDYEDCNSIYLLGTGKYRGFPLMKFGLSRRVLERELKEHTKTYGEQIVMIHVWKTDNNDKIEKIIKDEIKSRGLDIKLMFDGKIREELCVLNEEYDVNSIIKMIDDIVNQNPLPLLQEKEEQIKLLEDSDNKIILEIEKERTKQKEIEKERDIIISQEKTKQLELEYKIKLLDKEIKEENKIKESNPRKDYTDGEIKEILKPYFEYTGIREDVILNSKLDEMGYILNIKKNKMIKYLRTIGSTKYKCASIQGHRCIKIIKDYLKN